MRVLVTGGAGYVGSHTVRLLAESGHDVVVYDNLSYGHYEAVTRADFVLGDITDGMLLQATFRRYKIDAVMHFAAFAYVGESVLQPAKYYHNNVAGTLTLLEEMRAHGITRFVFSSSCATYGIPQTTMITEDQPQNPINPYGYSKLVIERVLADYAHAYGLKYAALRYFNASGASPDGVIGEDHSPETHLIPLVLCVALGQSELVQVFGTNLPTPDGTCVRDYVHVDDLASAHILALEQLDQKKEIKLNLGIGQGYSVNEVIELSRMITGHPIPSVGVTPRPGDPPFLVADASKARSELGWKPRYTSLYKIIETAWDWHRVHPYGYK